MQRRDDDGCEHLPVVHGPAVPRAHPASVLRVVRRGRVLTPLALRAHMGVRSWRAPRYHGHLPLFALTAALGCAVPSTKPVDTGTAFPTSSTATTPTTDTDPTVTGDTGTAPVDTAHSSTTTPTTTTTTTTTTPGSDCRFQGEVKVFHGSFRYVHYCDEVTPLEEACRRTMSRVAGRPLRTCPTFVEALEISGWMDGDRPAYLDNISAARWRTADHLQEFDQIIAAVLTSDPTYTLSGQDERWTMTYDPVTGELVAFDRYVTDRPFYCCGDEVVSWISYGEEVLDIDLSRNEPYEPDDFR